MVPLGLPSVISIATYLFLNSLSLMVMFLDDAAETAQAMAMALLILVTGLVARGLFYLLTRGVERRTQAWTQR
jgi:iron(III) transport system permease protein